MEIVYFLAPAAVTLGGIFLYLFIGAVRQGQFDDLDDPPVRILYDDEAK